MELSTKNICQIFLKLVKYFISFRYSQSLINNIYNYFKDILGDIALSKVDFINKKSQSQSQIKFYIKRPKKNRKGSSKLMNP